MSDGTNNDACDSVERWLPLERADLPSTIVVELEAETPDKNKLVEWLRLKFGEKYPEYVGDIRRFRNWLVYQFEHSEIPVFYRRFPRLQALVHVDYSAKINALRQRHCNICNKSKADQSDFPINHLVLRIRGRSRQSLSGSEFRAYQRSVREHFACKELLLNKHTDYCLSLTFVLNRGRKDRDIDNMSKTILDGVSRALNFND